MTNFFRPANDHAFAKDLQKLRGLATVGFSNAGRISLIVSTVVTMLNEVEDRDGTEVRPVRVKLAEWLFRARNNGRFSQKHVDEALAIAEKGLELAYDTPLNARGIDLFFKKTVKVERQVNAPNTVTVSLMDGTGLNGQIVARLVLDSCVKPGSREEAIFAKIVATINTIQP